MLKIENHHALFKNNTGAVVTTDQRAYQKAKEKKAEKNKINLLEEKITKLEKLLESIVNGDIKKHN